MLNKVLNTHKLGLKYSRYAQKKYLFCKYLAHT